MGKLRNVFIAGALASSIAMASSLFAETDAAITQHGEESNKNRIERLLTEAERRKEEKEQKYYSFFDEDDNVLEGKSPCIVEAAKNEMDKASTYVDNISSNLNSSTNYINRLETRRATANKVWKLSLVTGVISIAGTAATHRRKEDKTD
jgi:hypothetical protein